MKIKFTRLIIDNFLSFGHAEIDLKDRGYTLVQGKNENPKDAAKSNGSGKSSIFNALCFALTGETIQGLSSNLNNIYTKNKMQVTVEFFADSDYYVITRSRDVNNKADLKISVNNVDKSGKGIRESDDILKKLLPDITSDLIGEVIIIGQGMPHKFSNNTPSGRKELLEKLSHSDYMLEDIKNRVENRCCQLRDELNDIKINKDKKKTTISITESNIKAKELDVVKYNNKPNFSKEKSLLNDSIQKDENYLISLRETLKENELKLTTSLSEKNKLIEDKNKAVENETAEFNKHNLIIKTSITEKNTIKKQLIADIDKIKNIKDICPMCHQKIPHVHKQDTSEYENKLTILNEELSQLNDKNIKQEQAYSLNLQDIKDNFLKDENKVQNTIDELTKNINELKEKIKATDLTITNAKIKLNSIVKDEEVFDKEKEKCLSDLESLKNQQTLLNKELLYIINKEEEVKTHQEVITKITTTIKRDFRGVLLSNIITYIDKKCKIYAKDIFGTDELDFKLNGNNLEISYLNKPLEALSGGEQQKVDLILQFAIRAMMSDYTGFTSNIIVLDEILDNLDSVGCDAILNFITNRLSDIESIFIISHHADTLNIGNDSFITVVKNNDGVSHIQ